MRNPECVVRNKEIRASYSRRLRAPERCRIHDLQAGNPLKLLGVERGNFVGRREASGGDLQVVGADH